MEAFTSSATTYITGLNALLVDWVLRHPMHAAVEALLLALILVLLLRKSYRPTGLDVPLSKAEEDVLIAEWEPTPLVEGRVRVAADSQAQLAGPATAVALVQQPGQDAPLPVINLGTTGFLGYQTHRDVIAAALACTKVYGVGACGPRGFYGSLRPHLDCEAAMAKFMRAEDAVLFSAEFQVPASVVPAFAKPGDVLLVDSGVHFGWSTGAHLSRAEVREWEHNNVSALEKQLQTLELQGVFRQARQRVFVLIESIYANHGDVAPLQAIVDLKKRYPFRIMLDESLAVGVLGAGGRGLWEACRLEPGMVELLCFSLGHALGSVGGIAVGRADICNHMRLNCTGYVFSCASPPFVAQAVVTALDLLAREEARSALAALTQVLHAELPAALAPFLRVHGDARSPIVHLRLAPALARSPAEDSARLARLASALLEGGQGAKRRRESPRRRVKEAAEWELAEGRVLVAQPHYAPQERCPPVPSLRLGLHAGLPVEGLRAAITSLRETAQRVLGQD